MNMYVNECTSMYICIISMYDSKNDCMQSSEEGRLGNRGVTPYRGSWTWYDDNYMYMHTYTVYIQHMQHYFHMYCMHRAHTEKST